MSDLNAFPLFKLGSQNLYGTDVFFGIALVITGWVVLKRKFLLRKALLPLNLLLLTVTVALVYGLMKFGMSSIGEGRMIYSFFYISVPFFLDEVYRFDKEKTAEVINNTILITGGAAFLMLLIEFLNGGRFFFYGANTELLSGFEDFRGIRYLDADANFALNFLAFYFLAIALFNQKKVNYTYLGLFIILFIIIVLIKNRSALASLIFSFALYFIFQSSLKLLLRTTALIFLLIFILVKVLPSSIVNELIVSYSGIINITEDETGSWRMLVQFVAFNQALQTPLLGQGFGGYYDFYIPELDLSFDYPPHNIYVLLFLKGGVFCVISAFAGVIYLSRKYYKLSLKWKDPSNVKVLFVAFTILCLSQFFYGMAYAFYQFFFLLAGFMILLVRKIQVDTSSKTNFIHKKSP
jgi:hypothetical protein